MPTITGYFEDDGSDIQQKETLAGEVDMEFELDDDGDIMPRTSEANPVFPAQGNVLVAENSWGWAGEYAGTFDEAARNTDPGISNVLAPTSYKIQNANLTGTATGETHTANQVLKSAGGNYNDDNLSVGNIRPVAFGLSQTGTLANLASTDAAYVSLEATRNTDMAAEKVEDGYDYTTRGTTRTGTLDCTSPSEPTLAASDNEDGSGATFTMSGEEAGTTNTLYVASMSDMAFSSKGSTWTGGEIDVALDTGLYIAYIKSVKSGVWSYSNTVRVTVSGSEEAADDNMAIVRRITKQTAVLWRFVELDDQGQPTYNSPVEIKCRWLDKTQEVVTAKGDRIASSAYLIVDRDIPLRSVVLFGSLDVVIDTDDPKENVGAYEIVDVKKTADKKCKRYLREVYV
jgi:hypothetical protein